MPNLEGIEKSKQMIGNDTTEIVDRRIVTVDSVENSELPQSPQQMSEKFPLCFAAEFTIVVAQDGTKLPVTCLMYILRSCKTLSTPLRHNLVCTIQPSIR